MDVSVRELKNRLSEYLRRVQAGEVVHVTLRGRRVARLSAEAFEPDAARESEAEAIARLDAMPWIQPPLESGQVRGLVRPIPWPEDERPLSQIILDDRE
jgi:prevent-host-death family protein